MRKDEALSFLRPGWEQSNDAIDAGHELKIPREKESSDDKSDVSGHRNPTTPVQDD